MEFLITGVGNTALSISLNKKRMTFKREGTEKPFKLGRLLDY
jgi:hypothetical protein